MSNNIEVRAPQEQSEGTRSQVQRWLKNIGEAVAKDEPLLELETDKVTVEIAAPADGVLREILKQEQEDVEPGELLAYIGEAAAADAGAAAQPAAVAPAAALAGKAAAAEVRTAAYAAHAGALAGRGTSPAVRRLLSQHGLDEAAVQGSGAGGRITIDDVLNHVAANGAAPAAAAAPSAPAAQPAAAPVPENFAGERVAHTSMRKRIAEHMVKSLLHTAPHVTTVFEADFTAIMAHRKANKADFESRGASLTLTAYFLAACVDAIREVPEVNARWTDDALLIPENINIGVGTALEGRGLVVPVVRDVQNLDLFGIAKSLSDLVNKARTDTLTPADVRDGTFTISNHGVSGSLVATPIIINQPQSAILGVGKLEKRPVVITENGEDRIEARPRCFITLTLDHRVMDGHRANRFMQVFVDKLENWPA